MLSRKTKKATSKGTRKAVKRPAPPPSPPPSPFSASSGSSTSGSPLEVSTSHLEDRHENDSNSGRIPPAEIRCPVCWEVMKEPTATYCGHSYCRECIEKALEETGRCPTCGVKLEKDKVCVNFALVDILKRNGQSWSTSSKESVRTDVIESTSGSEVASSNDEDLVNLLMRSNVDKLSVNELDRLLLVLRRKRELMATEEEGFTQQLMLEFLGQMLGLKTAALMQITNEVDLIKHDMERLTIGAQIQECSPGPSCSSSFHFGGGGFNTSPLGTEVEQKTLTARRRRVEKHFDELMDSYFTTRNAGMVAEVEDVTLDGSSLTEFGTTLKHATQYHRFRPLATLSYGAEGVMELISSSTNVITGQSQVATLGGIVSSIAFDKDSEFFALAGVTKKIKVFEYVTVIGSPEGTVKCSNAELNVDSKVSCVMWNAYFKNRLASADYNGLITVWDAEVNSRVRNFTEHEKRAWTVDWSPTDPRLVASGSDDATVKLWSCNSDKSVGTLKTPTNVCSVKFCPASSYSIAVGTADHCIYIYDFRQPKEPLGILWGHKKTVSYVQFPSASNNELLSASTDGSLKLWNLEGGWQNGNWQDGMSCSRTFTGHVNAKNFTGLDTDGKYIACGSEDNCLYVYYKMMPKPLFTFKFESYESPLSYIGGRPSPEEPPKGEFVSAVAWRRGSPVVVAANSLGIVKILELV